MYSEDLAVKCVSCVHVCGCCDTVFCNARKKNYNCQCFGHVCGVHTLEATAMFGQEQVCASTMVAEIQQCLAVSNCIYDGPWPSVCVVWVCARNRD